MQEGFYLKTTFPELLVLLLEGLDDSGSDLANYGRDLLCGEPRNG